jgi:Lrp/AsnC family transcriptional regulator for asnA, asnC and gidA
MGVDSLDELDEKILVLLKDHGRAPYMDIAKRVGLSEGAVRKRIKAMVDSGVISKFTVQLGFTKEAKAVILLSVNPRFPIRTVSDNVKKVRGVENVYEITGQYDIVAMVSSLNIAEVNRCIDEIRDVKGVSNTNTMIVLRQP